MGLFVLLLLAGGGTVVQAQDGFPEPSGTTQLFYLQRTSNKNTIVYELNKRNGEVDKDNPVHALWIRYEENGQRQELSYIQRRFAYGVRSKKIKDDHYQISLNAYDRYQMELVKEKDGQYRVYALANGKKIQLQRIFIKITGGTAWSPDIEYFEIKGLDVNAGETVAERMKLLKTEAVSR